MYVPSCEPGKQRFRFLPSTGTTNGERCRNDSMLTTGTAVIVPCELARVELVHESRHRGDRRVLAAVDPADQRQLGPSPPRRARRTPDARAPPAARARTRSVVRSIMSPPRAPREHAPPAAPSTRSGTPPWWAGAGRAPDPRSSRAAPARSGSADGTGSRSAGRSGSAGRPHATLCDSRPGTSLGIAVKQPLRVRCRGFVNSSSVGASSTMRPRYMTATRSATCRTTAMLCAISTRSDPASRAAPRAGQHRRLHRHVERRHRLVRDEQLRLERQRPRDRNRCRCPPENCRGCASSARGPARRGRAAPRSARRSRSSAPSRARAAAR